MPSPPPTNSLAQAPSDLRPLEEAAKAEAPAGWKGLVAAAQQHRALLLGDLVVLAAGGYFLHQQGVFAAAVAALQAATAKAAQLKLPFPHICDSKSLLPRSKLPFPHIHDSEKGLLKTIWLLLASVIMVSLICKIPGGSPVLGFLGASALIGPYATELIDCLLMVQTASSDAAAACAGYAAALADLLAAGAATPSSDVLHSFSQDARQVALVSQRPAVQPLSPAAVLSEFTSSLSRQAVAEVAHANPGTRAAASSVAAEFTTWLAARSAARGGVTAQTYTPEDVAVFFETQWLKQHGSLQLREGSPSAAPSYLKSAVSHLSSLFKKLGREVPYDYARQAGSPCLSDIVRSLKTTYRKTVAILVAFTLGFRLVSLLAIRLLTFQRR